MRVRSDQRGCARAASPASKDAAQPRGECLTLQPKCFGTLVGCGVLDRAAVCRTKRLDKHTRSSPSAWWLASRPEGRPTLSPAKSPRGCRKAGAARCSPERRRRTKSATLPEAYWEV